MNRVSHSIVAICMILLSFHPSAVAAEPQPQRAPLSPYFQQFQSNKLLQKNVSRMLAAPDEAVPKSTGYIPSPVDYSYLRGKAPLILRSSSIQRVYAPLQFDLRPLQRVTPVRDQGSCGACWAFGSLASVESVLMPSETTDYSENNLKNTSGFDWPSCSGGNPDMALAYFSRWSGPIAENNDPYSEISSASPSGLLPEKHLQEVLIIPGRGTALDNDAIKQTLMDHGAITTSIYVDGGATSSSNSAYFKPSTNSYYYNGTAESNHIVAIVGWDDTYSAANFSTRPPGNGAFIIKNSWGTTWGDSGYFYISYYDSIIGNNNYLFKAIENTNNYHYSYQYDPFGRTSSSGYGSTMAWFANMFVAKGAEKLAAVAFHTDDINVAYNIYIYKGVTANIPDSGTLASTFSGTIPYPGYHTVSLPSTVNISAGERFSIVVKATNSSDNYPIPLETPVSNYATQVTASAGQSFMSWNGTTWSDVHTAYPDTNVTLKAFTRKQDFSVNFMSSGNGILEGQANQTVYYGDNAAPVTAIPANGYHFVNWTGTGGFVTSSANPLTLYNITASQTITANFEHDPVDGLCGSSHASTFSTAPLINLCTAGTATVVNGSGPWNWGCNGSFGGTFVTCSAYKGFYLTLTFPGNGGGSINGDMSCTTGIACPSRLFISGKNIRLLSSPDTISLFGGWSNACTGSGNCTLTMSSDKTVSVTFIKAPKAMIGVTGYQSLNLAYSAASSTTGAKTTIKLLDDELVETLNMNLGKEIILQGGYHPDFSRGSGTTRLKGILTVRSGNVTIDRIVIK